VSQILADPDTLLPLLGSALICIGGTMTAPSAALRRLRNRRS